MTALNIPSVATPYGMTVTNAYAEIVGQSRNSDKTQRVSVSFYASAAAAAANNQALFTKDYNVPGSAPLAAITPLADSNGIVWLDTVSYELLLALGGDFSGATIVA